MSSLAHKLPCMPSTAVRELLCTQTALHAQHQCAQPPWHQSMTSHVHTPLAHLPPGSMISLRPVCTSSCVHNLLAHPAPLCMSSHAHKLPCTPSTSVHSLPGTSMQDLFYTASLHAPYWRAWPPMCTTLFAHPAPVRTASLHIQYRRAWPPMCASSLHTHHQQAQPLEHRPLAHSAPACSASHMHRPLAHPAPTRRASHVHRSPCTLSTNVHKRFTHPEPTHTTSHGR